VIHGKTSRGGRVLEEKDGIGLAGVGESRRNRQTTAMEQWQKVDEKKPVQSNIEGERWVLITTKSANAGYRGIARQENVGTQKSKGKRHQVVGATQAMHIAFWEGS